MSKRDAAIYRKAAQRVEQVDFSNGTHRYSCAAIGQVLPGYEDALYDSGSGWFNEKRRLCQKYGNIFEPKPNTFSWFGNVNNEKNRGPRIVALCFAAAMADAGDL